MPSIRVAAILAVLALGATVFLLMRGARPNSEEDLSRAVTDERPETPPQPAIATTRSVESRNSESRTADDVTTKQSGPERSSTASAVAPSELGSVNIWPNGWFVPNKGAPRDTYIFYALQVYEKHRNEFAKQLEAMGTETGEAAEERRARLKVHIDTAEVMTALIQSNRIWYFGPEDKVPRYTVKNFKDVQYVHLAMPGDTLLIGEVHRSEFPHLFKEKGKTQQKSGK